MVSLISCKSKDEFWRLVLVILILLVALYTSSVGMAFADNRGMKAVKKGTLSGHLEDLGQDFVGWIFGRNWNISFSSNDYSVVASVIFTFFYVLFSQAGRRTEIYIRWILIASLIYLIRSVGVFSTVSPWAKHYEGPQVHGCHHWPDVAAAPYDMVFKGWKTCYDTFFSGHVANVTICCMVIGTFRLPAKWKWLYYIILATVWMLWLLTIIFILYLEVHYSTDIEVGAILGIVFWLLIDYQIQLKTGFFSWWEPNCVHYSHSNYDLVNKDNKDNQLENRNREGKPVYSQYAKQSNTEPSQSENNDDQHNLNTEQIRLNINN